jgi:hypothetical protein
MTFSDVHAMRVEHATAGRGDAEFPSDDEQRAARVAAAAARLAPQLAQPAQAPGRPPPKPSQPVLDHVVATLRSAGGSTVNALAELAGLSAEPVACALRWLRSAGQVRCEKPVGPKPGVWFAIEETTNVPSQESAHSGGTPAAA